LRFANRKSAGAPEREDWQINIAELFFRPKMDPARRLPATTFAAQAGAPPESHAFEWDARLN
jgi:hypothetical protein